MPAYHTTQEPTAGTPTATGVAAEGTAGLQDPQASLDLGEGNDQSGEVDSASLIAADEAVASRKGWVSKEQYKGDPTKWVDARTFIDRGERFNANLQRELEVLKRRIGEFEGTKTAFKKFHEETLAAKDQELKVVINQLKIQRSQAIREGDDEVALQIDDRIDLLREQQNEVKAIPQAAVQERTPGPNPEDPVLLEWIADGNNWFSDDPKLRDYSVALGEDLIKQGVTVRGRKFLDMIALKMAEEFPRRFASKSNTGARQNPVEGAAGRASPRTTGQKTEADLPEADRALMKQFVKEGWVKKEEFLNSYFSRNA